MSIRLLTLGMPRVEVDAVDCAAFQRHKLWLALLTFVGVERVVSRDRVIGVFWPDRESDSARHTLSQTMYEVRKELPVDPFVVDGDRIRVADDVWVDSTALDAAVDDKTGADACRYYTGPFLDGAYLWRTSEWEHWVDAQRSRLVRLHRRARRLLLAEMDQQDGLRDALAAAREWIELDPYDDEANHHFIDLLARSGQRADALKHFEAYASRLRDELDIEPLDETRELVERIRDTRDVQPGVASWQKSVRPDAEGSTTGDAGRVEADAGASTPDDDFGGGIEVIRSIGEGSVAIVYLAREVALQRLIAVKVMAGDLAQDRTARLRFQREAEASARLHHPNVVPVYSVGLTRAGRPFLTMPYVKGGSLADRLAAWGPFDVDEAARILTHVAAGLAAAHRVGVIHRDVRPANVLYEQDSGRSLLCDFGLAAILDELNTNAVRITRTGEWIGNPSCVSPEQLLGQPVTEKTDVYGLGNLGFELLAGRGPFDASTPAELTIAHVRTAPHKLDRFRKDAPGPVVDLIDRCLAKRPEHRPTMEEVLGALRA